MNTYTANEIAQIVNGTIEGNGDIKISRLLIDSRNLVFPAESIFIALVGERNDGSLFIPELYKKGIKCFITSKQNFEKNIDATYIFVKNSLIAFQELVSKHRAKFSYPVIGITGSNGKTVVKEWLFELLKNEKKIVRNPRSYNSQVGVPLSVWQMDNTYDFAIYEAGISKVGEMQKLEKIIKPDIGVFTNIGPAHQENFDDYRQKISEKLKLFINSKQLVYSSDYDTLYELANNFCNEKNVKHFVWGKSKNADLQIISTNKIEKITIIELLYNSEKYEIKLPFIDDASIENCIICLSVLLVLGFSIDYFTDNIKSLTPIAMRLQMNEAINNCTLINDTYNSDLASLRIAINFLVNQNQHKKRAVVLSDILQSGYNDEILYNEVADLINNNDIELFVGIGSSISRFANKINTNKYFFRTSEEFLKNLPIIKLKNCTVLLKGARIFEFEKISKRLQQKAHETVLEINLNSLVNNLNQYKSLIGQGCQIMAMVKAFSYGSGVFEIANILQYEKVNYLAVAYADEGVELRQAGISVPIMVMSPEPGSFEMMLEYNLEPEIYNLRVLQLFSDEVKHLCKQNVNIHIKIDTGMHRLGFEESEIDMLLYKLQNNKLLKVKSVFTHLTSTDDAADDNFTISQIQLYNKITDKIEKAIQYKLLKHVLNSAGTERFSEYSFNMVRIGIGLYGFCTNNKLNGKLQNVLSLKTVISQIKNINENSFVGYNRKGKILKDSIIATIPIGYADGLNRKLGNGNAEFTVNGIKVKTIGNICMDMCMLDVTNANAHEGDEVVIFNSVEDISKISETIGTIPYEVLTGISRRVKRIYYHE